MIVLELKNDEEYELYDDVCVMSNLFKTMFYGENIDYHTIRTDKIERKNYNYKDILSQSIIDKYKHIDKELYNIK